MTNFSTVYIPFVCVSITDWLVFTMRFGMYMYIYMHIYTHSCHMLMVLISNAFPISCIYTYIMVACFDFICVDDFLPLLVSFPIHNFLVSNFGLFFIPPRELSLAFIVTLVWWWRMVKSLPEIQETSVWSLGWEDTLEKGISPLQYSWLENSRDRGAWGATVHGVTKSWTWLSTFHFSGLDMFVSGFILPEVLYTSWTGWLFLFPC